MKTFQPVLAARMLVTDTGQFRVSVGNAFVTFDHSAEGGLTFSDQPGQPFASGADLAFELLCFRGPFGMRLSSALAFMHQALGLLGQPLNRTLQLMGNFTESFGGRGMGQ